MLTSYEMEGLLQAHDSIASLTDRAYCTSAQMTTTNMNMNTMPSKIPLHQSLSNNLQNHDVNKGYSSSTEDIKKVRFTQSRFMH